MPTEKEKSLVIRKIRFKTRDNTGNSQPLKLKRLTISSVGKDMEQLELSFTADGDVIWCNHFGK